jgi:hypothetical protein
MGKLKGTTQRRSGRRRVSEQVVQALAVTSQMALLYPPGIDEWMRRELGGDDSGHPSMNGANRTNGAR